MQPQSHKICVNGICFTIYRVYKRELQESDSESRYLKIGSAVLTAERRTQRHLITLFPRLEGVRPQGKI